MSWAEVSKINNDFTEPLNYLAYIQDLAVFGKRGYVYNDNYLMSELYFKSDKAKSNPMIEDYFNKENKYYLEYYIQQNKHIGNYFADIIPSSDPVFDSLPTIDDIVDNETAMTAVANSETAMTAVINSVTAMTAVINSVTAMTAVANSETAMTAVINSETAMTAVANSETAMTAVANSETAMTAVINSETAMTAVANSEVACSAIRVAPSAIQVLDNSDPVTVPTMTGYTTPSGRASASTEYPTKSEAWRAFDKKTGSNDSWVSNTQNTNQWVEYEFETPVWLYKFDKQIRTGSQQNEPEDFRIEYYNETDWVTAISGKFANSANKQEFLICEPTGKRKRWRIFCLNNIAKSGGMTIGELQFYGK